MTEVNASVRRVFDIIECCNRLTLLNRCIEIGEAVSLDVADAAKILPDNDTS
jgi:hypothetical protein